MPRADDADLVLYTAPRTRGFSALWLLEELVRPYRLEAFDLESGRHKTEDFLALNPMGKVPVVLDDGVPLSEIGAIAIQLADKYREVPLAPEVTSDRRPEYLRWVFFASAIMEPAFAEKMFGWEVPARSVAWGGFANMKSTLEDAVAEGEYLLDAMSAADVTVGSMARFGVQFGVFEKEGPIAAYVARLMERPAFRRALEIEEELVKTLLPEAQG